MLVGWKGVASVFSSLQIVSWMMQLMLLEDGEGSDFAILSIYIRTTLGRVLLIKGGTLLGWVTTTNGRRRW